MMIAFAIQFENRFALVSGQTQKDLNPEDLQKRFLLNHAALTLVSCPSFESSLNPKVNFFFFFLLFLQGLVIDGSIAYPFNDGSHVLLEIHPSDALLTANLNPD